MESARIVRHRMRVVLRKHGGQVVKLLRSHLLEADDIDYLRSYHVSAERFSMNPIILAVGGSVVSDIAAKHFHVVSPLAIARKCYFGYRRCQGGYVSLSQVCPGEGRA